MSSFRRKHLDSGRKTQYRILIEVWTVLSKSRCWIFVENISVKFYIKIVKNLSYFYENHRVFESKARCRIFVESISVIGKKTLYSFLKQNIKLLKAKLSVEYSFEIELTFQLNFLHWKTIHLKLNFHENIELLETKVRVEF